MISQLKCIYVYKNRKEKVTFLQVWYKVTNWLSTLWNERLKHLTLAPDCILLLYSIEIEWYYIWLYGGWDTTYHQMKKKKMKKKKRVCVEGICRRIPIKFFTWVKANPSSPTNSLFRLAICTTPSIRPEKEKFGVSVFALNLHVSLNSKGSNHISPPIPPPHTRNPDIAKISPQNRI